MAQKPTIDAQYGLKYLEEAGLLAGNSNIFSLDKAIDIANETEQPIACSQNLTGVQFVVVPASYVTEAQKSFPDFDPSKPRGKTWKNDVNTIEKRAEQGPFKIEETVEVDGNAWSETKAVIMPLDDYRYWEARKDFDPKKTASEYGPLANFARGFAEQAKFKEVASEGCMIPSERDNSKATVTISQEAPKQARHIQDISLKDSSTQTRIIAHAFDMARKNGVSQTLQLSDNDHPTRFLQISALKSKI